jgi:hypothetical protein
MGGKVISDSGFRRPFATKSLDNRMHIRYDEKVNLRFSPGPQKGGDPQGDPQLAFFHKRFLYK